MVSIQSPDLFTLDVENDLYVHVGENSNINSTMISIRKYITFENGNSEKIFPSKEGISLSIMQWIEMGKNIKYLKSAVAGEYQLYVDDLSDNDAEENMNIVNLGPITAEVYKSNGVTTFIKFIIRADSKYDMQDKFIEMNQHTLQTFLSHQLDILESIKRVSSDTLEEKMAVLENQLRKEKEAEKKKLRKKNNHVKSEPMVTTSASQDYFRHAQVIDVSDEAFGIIAKNDHDHDDDDIVIIATPPSSPRILEEVKKSHETAVIKRKPSKMGELLEGKILSSKKKLKMI